MYNSRDPQSHFCEIGGHINDLNAYIIVFRPCQLPNGWSLTPRIPQPTKGILGVEVYST